MDKSMSCLLYVIQSTALGEAVHSVRRWGIDVAHTVTVSDNDHLGKLEEEQTLNPLKTQTHSNTKHRNTVKCDIQYMISTVSYLIAVQYRKSCIICRLYCICVTALAV